MVTTRESLQKKVSTDKSNISSKQSQINSARKRSRFRGITVKAQFKVGKRGVKPFRKKRKIERRIALGEVNLFGEDLIGLQNTLSISEKDLADFNLLGGGL